MSWCKLHTDILGDAKLLRAARKGARHLVLLPWLLAWAKAHDAEDVGRLLLDGQPVEPEDIAAQMPGTRPADVAACMAALEAIGVLERDGPALRFAAWPTRSGTASQKPSDHPEAVRDRVQRHRAKVRATHAPAEPAPVTVDALPETLTREVTPECNDLKRVTDVTTVTQNKNKSKNESEKEIENTDSRVTDRRVRDRGGFLRAWAEYPRRAGGNSAAEAERQYHDRLREGECDDLLHARTVAFHAYCDAVGWTGTQYVMQGARFYGKKREYANDWTPPAPTATPLRGRDSAFRRTLANADRAFGGDGSGSALLNGENTLDAAHEVFATNGAGLNGTALHRLTRGAA